MLCTSWAFMYAPNVHGAMHWHDAGPFPSLIRLRSYSPPPMVLSDTPVGVPYRLKPHAVACRECPDALSVAVTRRRPSASTSNTTCGHRWVSC